MLPTNEGDLMLTINPQGLSLTEDQASRLDAEFFRSSPLEYFVPRIEQLLLAGEREPDHGGEAVQSFRRRLGLPPEDPDPLDTSDSARGRQRAVDAISVRHHAAETLLRLLYALSVAEPRASDARSVWVAIADSPISMKDVAEAVAERLNAHQPPSFPDLFLPIGIEVDTNLQRALEVAVAWTNHAIGLLTRDELAVNTGFNKVKHGLSVSTRDDVRVEIMTAPALPEDGTIPLSAFESSVPLFDRPLLTFVYRPARRAHLETASLRVDVETTLVEAWMISVVAGAVFAVAGRGRFPESEDLAAFPTLPIGPTPDQLLGDSVLGSRAPITEPTIPGRESGVFFHGSFQPIQFDFENVASAVITEG